MIIIPDNKTTFADYHTHTVFSDGHGTPEENVLSAIDKGLVAIGISDHSYTDFDLDWCMKKEDIDGYLKTVNALKPKYADKIKVFTGIEQDYYSNEPYGQYDYVIGSVHYVKIRDEYVPIDNKPHFYTDAAEKYYKSDVYSLVEAYYDVAGDICNRMKADIIGHFDIITKFNEKAPMIDTSNERYIKAWQSAVDELTKHDVIFEINTGAITRGYRTTPYPALDIYGYLQKKGAKFVVSSDSHTPENVAYRYENIKDYIK